MVYMGGHISGGHYNPAVSFGVFLRRKLDAADMVAYWVAQLVGAALAFVFGYLASGHTPGIHPGAKVQVLQALAVEIVFTAALVLVVLNVAAPKAILSTAWRSASPSLPPYSPGARSLEVPSIQPSVSAPLSGRPCSRAAAGRISG